MDREERQLAANMLDIYAEHTIAEHEIVKDRIEDRHIAVSGASSYIELQRAKALNAQALGRVSQILPLAELPKNLTAPYSRSPHFTFSSEYDAINAQNSTIWIPDWFHQDMPTKFFPAWIIGKKLLNKKEISLLLLNASPPLPFDQRAHNGWLQQVHIPRKKFKEIKQNQEKRLTFPEGSLPQVLGIDTEQFRIGAYTPGTMRIEGHTYGGRKLCYIDPTGNTQRIRSVGSSGNSNSLATPDSMTSYAVYSHLNNLARLFGRVEQLRDIYNRWDD